MPTESLATHFSSAEKRIKMATSVKRKLEMDVSEVQDTYENHSITIHGIVGCISPVKTSRKDPKKKYFNAAISDSKKTMRMVSFDPSIRPQLENNANRADEDNQPAVALENCLVKKNSFQQLPNSDPTYEILLTTRSRVLPSPSKKFRVAADDFKSVMPDSATVSDAVSISDLELIAVNSRILNKSFSTRRH